MTIQDRVFSFETRQEAIDYLQNEIQECARVRSECYEAYEKYLSACESYDILLTYLLGVKKMSDEAWNEV